MPLAATAVALQAARAAEIAWARALGRAAVMLGVIASRGGVLYFSRARDIRPGGLVSHERP
jgi:hypothetical protein